MKLETLDQAIEHTGIKILVYGMAGAGKTVLSATTGTTTVILSAEAGLLSLKNIPDEIKQNIVVIKIKTMADLNEAYLWLQSGKMAEWLVVDSLSEVAEVLLGSEKDKNKDARGAYGDMADEMMKQIRKLRDISFYNVLMTAKMGRIKDEFRGVTSYVPMMPGKILTNQLPYMFDEIFVLRVEPHPQNPGQFMRVLQTGVDVSYDCKDRSGMLNMFEPPDISNIAKKIGGSSSKLATEEKTDIVEVTGE